MKTHLLRGLLAAVLVVTAACSRPGGDAARADAAEAGLKPAAQRNPAPDFVLKDADGRDMKLSDLKGKVVLLNFWATWCGPCKQLGPVLEKLAADYHGAFVLARVDVDAQKELAGYFSIRSVPTVILVKQGQLVDGFPGALPEGQLRQFLAQHGIQPAAAPEPAQELPPTPEEEAARLRAAVEANPGDDALKLDLALALARVGETAQAKALIDALPANLGADDRARNANVLIANAAHLAGAPDRDTLAARVTAAPDDLRARHLLGLRLLADGEYAAALEQFLAMLRQERDFDEGLPRRALIEAFNVIPDAALVSDYRRRMAALLF